MKKQIKMVFSDVDGTILSSKHQVLPGTKEKILELQRHKVPFVLVSGRMPKGIELIKKHIGIKAPMICFSGALILSENREIIHSNTINRDNAEEFYAYTQKMFPDICCNAYYIDDWIVADRQNPVIVNEESIVRMESTQCDLTQYLSKSEGVHKFLMIGSETEIQAAEEDLKEKFPHLAVAKSSPIYLEIMEGKTNKAVAVSSLCEYYGIHISEVLAFGDGMNDLEMLSLVEHSYAMENAAEQVKLAAGYVTDSNDNDGILKVLNEYF